MAIHDFFLGIFAVIVCAAMFCLIKAPPVVDLGLQLYFFGMGPVTKHGGNRQ